jgi:hypothetical protein
MTNPSQPTTTSQYTINFSKGFDGLQLQHNTPIPALGPNDCLIRIEAVSLNYRDIATPLGLYPGAGKDGIVPTSDGAGTILAVGDNVTEFQVGDRVCNTFFLDYQEGIPTAESRAGSLGVRNDGPLRHYAVFPTTALVKAPKHLNARQASTLPCAALTAWNALMGLDGCRLQPGQSILTQGTGGVSIVSHNQVPCVPAPITCTRPRVRTMVCGISSLTSTPVRNPVRPSPRRQRNRHHLLRNQSQPPARLRREAHHQLPHRPQLGRDRPQNPPPRPRRPTRPRSRR